MAERRDPGEVRGELSMGDALAAARALRPSDRAGYEAIIDLLGLALVPPREAGAGTLPPRRSLPSEVPVGPAGPAPELIWLSEQSGAPIAATLHELEGAPDAPAWLLVGDALPAPPRVRTRLRPEPPVAPAQARAAMAAAAGIVRAGRRLDVPRLVRRAARLRPLMPPPWRLELRTAPAVQLLVDEGEGMEPYADDVAFLAEQLTDVAGRDRVERHTFVRTPLRGLDPDALTGEEGTWVVPPGALVVAVTDLGAGGPVGSRHRGSAREWRQVAEAVGRNDAVLRVLTPFGSDRVPSAVAELAHVVAWDSLAHLVEIRA